MVEVAFSGLVFLLVGSNIYWAIVNHRLINKIMSRTFWEYQKAAQVPKDSQTELAEAMSRVKVKDASPNELDSLDELIKTVMPMG